MVTPLDLTLEISAKLPSFPGSPQPRFISWATNKDDGYNLETHARHQPRSHASHVAESLNDNGCVGRRFAQALQGFDSDQHSIKKACH